MRASVLSDLHITYNVSENIPKQCNDRIRRALQSAAGDVLLLIGDITNNSDSGQFRYIEQCLEQEASEKLVLSVAGNHDVLDEEVPGSAYGEFQHRLLHRAVQMGYEVEAGPASSSLSYAVQLGEVQVIALSTAAVRKGQFVYEEKEKILQWIKEKLDRSGIERYLIFSHAPLLGHNPHRNTGHPYLNMDGKLQKLLNTYQNIVFLSGHTHFSPLLTECVEYEKVRRNLYINCGSIVKPERNGNKIPVNNEKQLHVYRNGMFMELVLSSETIQITGKSVWDGLPIAECSYLFHTNK